MARAQKLCSSLINRQTPGAAIPHRDVAALETTAIFFFLIEF